MDENERNWTKTDFGKGGELRKLERAARGARGARAGGCQAGGPGLDKPSPAQPSLEPSLSDSEQADVQLSESDWEKVGCRPPGPADGVYFAPQHDLHLDDGG